MANKTSQHILSTSATLLGFCLFVITALHVSSLSETHIIDELTSTIAVLLTISSIFSFMSIRSLKPAHEKKYETIADYLFLVSLIGILVVILLIALNYVN